MMMWMEFHRTITERNPMAMTKEQVDELLAKPIHERKAKACNEADVTVIAWRDDDLVVGCCGHFAAGKSVRVWNITDLSPIEPPKPPKPKRMRLQIDGDMVARLTYTDAEYSYQLDNDFTHEFNLDDAYEPGDDLCSAKELADAEVFILLASDGRYSVSFPVGYAGWDGTHWPSFDEARKTATRLVRNTKKST